MKKIYMPTDKQLDVMYEMGANIHEYVVAKMIESLVVDGVNFKNKGMLRSAYDYLVNDPDVVRGVCYLYPEEIPYSQLAESDIELLDALVNKSSSMDVYNLDNLLQFSSIVTNNIQVKRMVVDRLVSGLNERPEYRFEFREGELLHQIFSCKLLDNMLIVDKDIVRMAAMIEPVYALSDQIALDSKERGKILIQGVEQYTNRYLLSDKRYDKIGKDTKRLVKAIRRNNYNLY